MKPTYVLGNDDRGYAFILCKLCNLASYHPEDVRKRYCGYCRRFHDDIDIQLKESKDDDGETKDTA